MGNILVGEVIYSIHHPSLVYGQKSTESLTMGRNLLGLKNIFVKSSSLVKKVKYNLVLEVTVP